LLDSLLQEIKNISFEDDHTSGKFGD